MSPAFLVFCGVVAVAVGLAASLCSRQRWYGLYLCLIGALTILGTAFGVISVPRGATLLSVGTETALFAPLGILYSVVPGLMVRRGSRPALIWVVTLLVSAGALPLWIFYGIYVLCYLGHDCL
jgi:hypothetical protein